MTDLPSTKTATHDLKRHLPDLPLVIWMVLLTLALGFAGGMGADDVIAKINTGFGRALGEFALILLPSFTLAAALSQRNVGSAAAGRTAALASPLAGGGMICPDTAYAALSPAAGRLKLDVAFGSYAGFKLLYPAGPLIVATGLGMTGAAGAEPVTLLICGVLLTLPVWAAGVIWGRFARVDSHAGSKRPADAAAGTLLITFAPFLLMTGLLIAGGIIGSTGWGLVDFLLLPKGALTAAAVLALLQTPSGARRGCLDSAVRRTGSLLLVIGAASALGAAFTGLVTLDGLVPRGSGMLTLVALFALTVLFKLAQGSSMATFAAIAPVAAPIVMTSGVNGIAAVFAICLGSFIAILPNDSFYWLVRRDALETEQSEARVIRILTGGAVVQALVGMAVLLAALAIWP
ncbi:transporter, gluconate:H+ symporter (GntP) family [Phaeobacter piscinae]|uniref:Transporter, gluconate:H+ symporter (GntP) family n=2 Tax=Phaeobacter piscinae TaxID=1580596 RepID=A0ABM6PG94_9RHOB|nr:permease [Phaeobacter piscinae]ATG36669.1 transporter, gluconate:H+ symporter (GntP) family [Phaeobacter piscinae]AUQ87190.1 transporter, gluconate:H+ symporter (GntP) family [Phaeobacter piscinae]AUR25073.1 transporter, gluconate:H+ symporter (GntP) family [Phaeobacter piscinae]